MGIDPATTFPGWYGVGSALDSLEASGEATLRRLSEEHSNDSVLTLCLLQHGKQPRETRRKLDAHLCRAG